MKKKKESLHGKKNWLSRWLGRKDISAQPNILPRPAQSPSDKPADYDQLRERGLRLLKAGNIPEALEALGQAVYLRPDLPDAHLNLGRALQQAGKIEAARQAYSRALKIDFNSEEAQSALAALPLRPPEREDFQVGQVLRATTGDRSYKVLEVKKGGFGAVYIVDNAEGNRYALKTFQTCYLWSDKDRQRFEREALTWVMLDRHPHIVSAHSLERIEGFPCLVLEFVQGGDLAQLLQQGRLSPVSALKLAFQFCDGMAYAHSKLGIVHRDINPSNCLLTKDGRLKVTDFGLARAFGEVQEEALGLAGLGGEIKLQFTTTLGTRKYMAPEQFQPGATLDTRTDIYAFGILLFEILTKEELPWQDGRVAHAHIEENADAYDDLPKELLSLILRCVQWEPNQRPRNFEEIRQLLESPYRALTGKAAPAPAKPSLMGVVEWTSKGLALVNLGRFEEALVCFERGLEINPHDSDLWNNKGGALRNLGRVEEALVCYERGLEINPRDSGLWINKGAVLGELGRFEESLACCDRLCHNY